MRITLMVFLAILLRTGIARGDTPDLSHRFGHPIAGIVHGSVATLILVDTSLHPGEGPDQSWMLYSVRGLDGAVLWKRIVDSANTGARITKASSDTAFVEHSATGAYSTHSIEVTRISTGEVIYTGDFHPTMSYGPYLIGRLEHDYFDRNDPSVSIVIVDKQAGTVKEVDLRDTLSGPSDVSLQPVGGYLYEDQPVLKRDSTCYAIAALASGKTRPVPTRHCLAAIRPK